jgi:hypothetical protein
MVKARQCCAADPRTEGQFARLPNNAMKLTRGGW